MDECIFCAIVAGKLPASKVCEDDQVLAFMDLRQPLPGHVLVIPKVHRENIYDLELPLAGKVFEVTAQVARAVRQVYQPDGLNLWQSNGRAAGQEVFHFHMHVFARKTNDGLFHVYGYPPGATERPILERMADEIRRGMESES